MNDCVGINGGSRINQGVPGRTRARHSGRQNFRRAAPRLELSDAAGIARIPGKFGEPRTLLTLARCIQRIAAAKTKSNGMMATSTVVVELLAGFVPTIVYG